MWSEIFKSLKKYLTGISWTQSGKHAYTNIIALEILDKFIHIFFLGLLECIYMYIMVFEILNRLSWKLKISSHVYFKDEDFVGFSCCLTYSSTFDRCQALWVPSVWQAVPYLSTQEVPHPVSLQRVAGGRWRDVQEESVQTNLPQIGRPARYSTAGTNTHHWYR